MKTRNLATLLCLIGWIISLTGCAPEPTLPPPATPQIVEAALTPGLAHWTSQLYACAQPYPQIALLTWQTPAANPDWNAKELALRLGYPSEGSAPAYSAQVGWEQLVVITHPDNPLDSLTTEQLRNILAGKITNWQEINPNYAQPILAWTYPTGDDLRQVFEQAVYNGQPPAIQAYLAPDPIAMLDAVTGDRGSIGYLPKSWLDAKQAVVQPKEIELSSELNAALRQPVLVFAAQEPQEAARVVVSCLQEMER